MSKITHKRLTFIDVVRAYAIFLALLAHTFAATGFFKQLGSDALLIKQFTRMATPLFVFIFGFMIEFVYVRRAQHIGLPTIYNRIFIRSFQCYIAYALTSFSAVLGGYKSIEGFLSSLLFFSNSRFGNILRTYSVMLLFVPFIIKLRLKFGVKFIFFSLILLITSYSFIDEFQSIDFGFFNHQFNILFGVGLHKGGPSVYGALSFCFAGMFMASSLSRDEIENDNSLSNFYFASLVLLITLLFLGNAFIKEDIIEAWKLFSGFTYRKNNAPAYYIIGTFGSVLTITLFCFLIGYRTLPKPIKFILPIGTSSLISYTAGNIILNLLSVRANSMNLFVFVILFFFAIILIVRHINIFPYFNFFSDLMNFKYHKASQRISR